MNYQKMAERISHSRTDSYEYWEAVGFLDCHAKAQKLVKALEEISILEYWGGDRRSNKIAQAVLDQWHKENEEGE